MGREKENSDEDSGYRNLNRSTALQISSSAWPNICNWHKVSQLDQTHLTELLINRRTCLMPTADTAGN